MAELLVEEHVAMPDLQSVCIREIQKSLKFSAKKLIESKIEAMGVGHLFDVQMAEIKRIGGKGLIIFQGMQDHTADSIKSLEGFDRAWVEEAQSLSHRSLELLIPTIRQDDSEIWFTWNPDQPSDAVEQLLVAQENEDAVVVHANYTDNPWCPDVMTKQAEWQRKVDYERYVHIWMGGYNTKSEAQIFAGRWRVDEFEPGADWEGPYQGLDFGFSQDPTAAVRCWIHDDRLWIEYDDGRVGLELDDTSRYLNDRIPEFKKHIIRADNARPESISYLRRKGLPRTEAVEKWSGSVEDGIEYLKTFEEIVIHTRCREMQEEARLYSYKVDKRSGDILPKIEDSHNHRWDACVEHGQLVATARGMVPVQRVVAGDYVQTRIGLREVLASKMTHEAAAIYELRTEGGKVLRATGDHRVYVAGKGYLRMDAIRYNDSVMSLEIEPCQQLNQSNMAVSCGTATQSQVTVVTANTSSEHRQMAGRSIFTDRFGRIASGPSQMAGMFTIKMKTARTMSRRIWNASLLPNTRHIMVRGTVGMTIFSNTSRQSDPSQRPGILRQRALSGIGVMASKLGIAAYRFVRNAISAAARSMTRTGAIQTGSAQTNASQHGAENKASMMNSETASSVVESSRSTSTEKPGFVLDRVLSVRATGESNKVYDLMVDEAEEFFASGVLVHNCRYALAPLIRNNDHVNRARALAS